jgi:protein TonB
MSGTLMRPAAGFSFPSDAIGTVNTRRLAAAAVAVVALHAGFLAFRPGVELGSTVAPSAAPVMAVRMVRVRPSAPITTDQASMPPELPIVARAAPFPPAATPGVTRAPSESVRQRQADARTASSEPAAPERMTAAPADVRPPAATVAADEAKGADAPLAAAPDYAFGARLDPGPRPLGDIEPDYPDPIFLRQGVVVLRVLVSETGHVDNVAVVRAEPRGVFEQAAIEAFSKARFSPGLAAGTPVKSQITVEVQFVPINRGGRVSGKTY